MKVLPFIGITIAKGFKANIEMRMTVKHNVKAWKRILRGTIALIVL